MPTIPELLQRASELPTFFPIDREIELMRGIEAAGVDEINAHMPAFLELVNRLLESHTIGSGYLMVDAANKSAFREFLDWVEQNDDKIRTGTDPLREICDELDMDVSAVPVTGPERFEATRARP